MGKQCAHKFWGLISALLLVAMCGTVISVSAMHTAQEDTSVAVVSFHDSNELAPITVNVGDTFIYRVRLRAEDTICLYGLWTYYNQPGKTMQEEEISEENRVLSLVKMETAQPFVSEGDVMNNTDVGVTNVAVGTWRAGANFSNPHGYNLSDVRGALVETFVFKVEQAGAVSVWTYTDQLAKYGVTGNPALPVNITDMGSIIAEVEYTPGNTDSTNPGKITEPVYSTEPTNLGAIGLYGDVNGDDVVALEDALIIRKHVAKLIVLTGDLNILGNVNSDAEIDIADALKVQRYVAKFPAKPVGEMAYR